MSDILEVVIVKENGEKDFIKVSTFSVKVYDVDVYPCKQPPVFCGADLQFYVNGEIMRSVHVFGMLVDVDNPYPEVILYVCKDILRYEDEGVRKFLEDRLV